MFLAKTELSMNLCTVSLVIFRPCKFDLHSSSSVLLSKQEEKRCFSLLIGTITVRNALEFALLTVHLWKSLIGINGCVLR